MALPDDPDFEQFIAGALNTSFSSTFHDDGMQSEDEDMILNNYSDESDVSLDYSNTVTPQVGLPIPGPSGIGSGTSISPQNIRQTQTTPSRPNWIDVTDNDLGYNHTIPIYDVRSGPTLPQCFDVDTEPIDYLYLFINDDLLEHICKETNMFAHKRQSVNISPQSRIRKWKDITHVELKAFLGVVINMGLMPLPSIESYFSTAWDNRVPFFTDVFNKDEFLNIFWNLHFHHKENDNTPTPKGFLISPILEHMKEMCRLFYTPSKCVSVDESTIAFKGKVSFRVYNPMKPTKYGLKVYVLSDTKNGYLYDFIPYYGSGNVIPNSDLLKTTQIVKTLATSVITKNEENPVTGLHIYSDRYYTSPQLGDELLKIGCYLTGTVMTNRVGMPPDLKKYSKKMKRGDIRAQRKGPTLVLSWKDKRPVHILTTNGKGSKNLMKDIPSKWPNKPPTPKPLLVLDYIKNMGGVDRSDHFISSYQFIRRTKKWYRKVFFWLFDVAIINAYLLYKHVQETNSRKPLSHRQFRRSLVRELVQGHRATHPGSRKRGRPAQGHPDERLDKKQHFISRKVKGSNKCVVCKKNGLRKETIYFCKTCTIHPFLHPDECFETYHTKADF